MRFLETSDLQFVHVPDSEIHHDNNQYAILSHRWGADEDEISFDDIQFSRDISKKKGLSKLKGFCKLALSEGCRYGWADTCCINKGNSSELEEAINTFCVTLPSRPLALLPNGCHGLRREITTRVEDRAYSRMGLFDVYMPIIYGERERAFLRLQQHIIQKSKDESIFAWCTAFPGNLKTYSGLFAPSPSAYVHCSEIIQTQGSGGLSEVNGELSIPLQIAPHSMETYSALLHCTHGAKPDDNVSILITPTSGEAIYVRVRDVGDAGHTLIPFPRQARFAKQQIRVLVDPTEPPVNVLNGFWLRTLQPPGYAQHQAVVLSNSRAPGADYVYQHEVSQGLAGLVHMRSSSTIECSEWSHVHWIEFGFDMGFNPVLWLASAKHAGRLQVDFEGALAQGPESDLHRKIMRFERKDPEDPWPSENDKWIEGAFAIAIDKKKGCYRQTFHAINLWISVELGTKDDFEQTDDSGLPLRPMKIWVVDITDIGGVTPGERVRRQEEDAERERQEIEARPRPCCLDATRYPIVQLMYGVLLLVLFVGFLWLLVWYFGKTSGPLKMDNGLYEG